MIVQVAVSLMLLVEGPTPPCTDGTFASCTPPAGCASGKGEKECDVGIWGGCYCVPTAVQCDDGNGCTRDGVEHMWCTHAALTGSSCSDGSSCTQADACNSAGKCVGTATPGASCSDGNECTRNDACSAAGVCVSGQLAIGATCTNTDLCGGPGACTADGTCAAKEPAALDDGNACTYDYCDGTGVHHDQIAGGCSSTTPAVENGGAPVVAPNPLEQPLPLGSTGGAPTVVENTGEVRYSYAFDLPPARGRFQPSLGLTYSSTSSENEGPGHGWTLSRSYVEQDAAATPNSQSSSEVPRRIRLFTGGEYVRLVLNQPGTAWVPEVVSGILELVPTSTGWTAIDSAGNTYKFETYYGSCYGPGGRWYLTSVSDVDGNRVQFSYEPEEGAAAVLTQIAYNSYTTAGGNVWASIVDLAYAYDGPQRRSMIAGWQVVTRRTLQSVSIQVVAPATGLKKLLRRYDLEHQVARSGPQYLLASITLAAGEGALERRLPATKFEYESPDGSGDYRFETAATTIHTASVEPGGRSLWVDLDADGFVDRVGDGLAWDRNVTALGADAIQLAPQVVAGADGAKAQSMTSIRYWDSTVGGYATDSYIHAQIIDFDGDRIPDLLKDTGAATLDAARCAFEVRFGQIEAGVLSYEGPVCIDASAAFDTYHASGAATLTSPGMSLGVRQQFGIHVRMYDVNQDGILDYSVGGRYFLGGSSGEAWFFTGWTGVWDVKAEWCGPGIGRVDAPSPREAFLPNPYPVDCNLLAGGGATLLGGFLSWDPRQATGWGDLDGDGHDDRVVRTNSCPMGLAAPCWVVAWGTDTGTTEGPSIAAPVVDDVPQSFEERAQAQCTYAWTTGSEFTREGETDLIGWEAGFVDLNGDGVAEWYSNRSTGSTTWVVYAGHVEPVILRKVSTSAGAVYSIEYEPAARYGASLRESTRWIAKSVALTGAHIPDATTYYWYTDPRTGQTADETLGRELRGFRSTWALETASNLVRATTWETGSHVFKGMPLTIEVGTTAWSGAYEPRTPPAATATLSKTSFQYSARGLGNSFCVDSAGEPASYPAVRVMRSTRQARFVGSVEFASEQAMACEDVDDLGNVLRRKLDPDASLAGDEYYQFQAFDGTAVCKSCPVETKVTSDASGSVLLRRSLYRYDSPSGTWQNPLPEMRAGNGHLNYVRRWVASTYGSGWEVAAAMAYNADGTVAFQVREPFAASHTYAVTEAYTYDTQRLRVTKSTISDTSTTSATLVRDTSYDDLGRVIREEGPYLSGSTSKPRVAFAYDAFGRRIATGRTISSSTVTGAISAAEYVDAHPPIVKTYRFLAPIYFTAGSVPVRSDIVETASYLDELGRTIEVRERLGVGGATDPGAQITQALTGYRVTTSVEYDAAGRVVASLEPMHSATGAFEGFAALAATPGARGSLTRYDAQGRVVCSKTGIYSALAANPGSCTSSLGDDGSYVAATAFNYTAVTNGQRYARAEAVSPGATSVGTRAYYGAAGRIAMVEDSYYPTASTSGNVTWYSYDVLGQVTSTGRQTIDAKVSAAAGRTVVVRSYDTAGRVVDETDDNWSPGTGPSRIYSYDASGRITRVQLAPQLVASSRVRAELRFEYKSLGRRTRSYALEPTSTTGGISFGTRDIAQFNYDRPYAGDSAAYPFTASNLSYASTPLTTIALGYNQNGAVVRRDQWFGGLTGMFSVSGSLADDGRPLASTFSSGYSRAVTATPRYDSLGRPVRIDAGATALWEAPAQSAFGAYDALGRAAVVRSNGGLVTTTRSYSANNGRLTAHSVQAGAATVYAVGSLAYGGGAVHSYSDSVTGTAYEYGYDRNGRLVSATASSNSTSPVRQTFADEYSFSDPSWQVTGGGAPTLGNLERVTTGGSTVEYDYLGDRVIAQRQGSPSNAVIATYLYDHAGRLFSKRAGGAETEGFSFDVQDQLRQVRRNGAVSEILEYDPTGALLFRKVGTKGFWYAGAAATITADVSPSCTSTTCVPMTAPKMAIHVGIAGTRIASMRASSSTADPAADVLYYHHDRQGSVIATTTTGGVVGAKYRYTPYGQLDRSDGVTAANDSDLGYTGGVRLGWTPGSQTGSLVLLGARVYHAELKRWLQPDTVDPQRYTFVGGNPANYVDPSGRARVSDMERLRPDLASFIAATNRSGLWWLEVPFDMGAMTSGKLLDSYLAQMESSIDRQIREMFGLEAWAFFKAHEVLRKRRAAEEEKRRKGCLFAGPGACALPTPTQMFPDIAKISGSMVTWVMADGSLGTLGLVLGMASAFDFSADQLFATFGVTYEELIVNFVEHADVMDEWKDEIHQLLDGELPDMPQDLFKNPANYRGQNGYWSAWYYPESPFYKTHEQLRLKCAP